MALPLFLSTQRTRHSHGCILSTLPCRPAPTSFQGRYHRLRPFPLPNTFILTNPSCGQTTWQLERYAAPRLWPDLFAVGPLPEPGA